MWKRFNDWLTHPDGRYRLEIFTAVILGVVLYTFQRDTQRQTSIEEMLSHFFAWKGNMQNWINGMFK